ncbi:hypothetical protein BN185_1790012 [Clostridioides difficile E28]|uniref:Uncharacterized protein n=1 Tax=Clostridioides difficile TaxID=1496 RepID=A0A069AAQ2_CLODI|nr:hypothetical protein BN185_1790012 [Clostridioides difficile E28]CDS85226.1 hypothetical protein BN1096_520167 [Clostridioides difficile]
MNNIAVPKCTSPPFIDIGNLMFINLVAINTNAINSEVSTMSFVVNFCLTVTSILYPPIY